MIQGTIWVAQNKSIGNALFYVLQQLSRNTHCVAIFLCGSDDMAGTEQLALAVVSTRKSKQRPMSNPPNPPNPGVPAQVIGSACSQDNSAEEGNLRYAAYANRLRTILLASHRYVAYTSDIGESFRPVAHPYLVKLGYGISWAYLIGDASYASWKVKVKSEGRYTPGLKPWNELPPANKEAADLYNQSVAGSLAETDWRVQLVKRGIFQSLASMAFPAFTIHSAVRYSSILFKNSPKTLKTYGPVGVGLGIVPLLPYIFDEPVEHAVDYVFDRGEALLGPKRLE